MSSKNNDLSEINEILEKYKEATEEALEYAIKETSQDTVEKLRQAKPQGAGKYGSWSDYLKSWTSTHTTKRQSTRKRTIYNEKHYRLAHLLEHGTKAHAMPNGGRHPGSRAFEHINPIAEKIEDVFIENLKKGLEK